LTGCGRYADFTLPPPDAAGPRAPFTWSAFPDPVMTRGGTGEWDSSDVLNPSVVKFQGSYLNLYSGFDGRTWHTGAASSSDGVHWGNRRRALSPEGWEGKYIAANGAVLVVGNELFYWYQAGDPVRIALARSRDGIAWNKFPEPVVPLGPRGNWDERGVADPYVIRAGDRYYMFYLGMDRARRQRLGVARSDDGVHWEKLRSNPILELGDPGSFDENGLGEPAVWSSGGSYWMLYTGRDRGEQRRIGLAKSLDGAHWEREASFKPLLGSEKWDSQVMCDSTVEVTADGIRVWFGGGDAARPDERIDGQIGLGILRGAP